MKTIRCEQERPSIWVSLFKNFTDSHPIGEVDVLHWLLEPSSEMLNALDFIRKTDDKEVRNFIKARLPAITPSGLFSVRKKEGLIAHSGLICLDIDAKENPAIEDWNVLKQNLPVSEHILYAGLSASGRGLFCLVPIADGKQHLQHFLALERDFKEAGIVLDPACKDIPRLRGFSHDPAAYVNFGAKPYEKVVQEAEKPLCITSVRPVVRGPDGKTDEVRNVEALTPIQRLLQPTDLSRVLSVLEISKSATRHFLDLLKKIEANRIDITVLYQDWFAIGCVVSTLFGSEGSVFFHRISQFYPRYDSDECEKLFCNIQKRGYRMSIDKLVSIAERYGVR